MILFWSPHSCQKVDLPDMEVLIIYCDNEVALKTIMADIDSSCDSMSEFFEILGTHRSKIGSKC